MAKMNVKKGDKVAILTGKDNGKTGTVLEVFPVENRVTVKGVNIIVKHKKARSAQEKGGITKYEGKIDLSNVQVICPVCSKATRVARGKNEKGLNVRLCKKCGAVLDSGKKPKKATTTKAAAEDASVTEEKVKKEPVKVEKSTATKQPAKPRNVETKVKASAQKVGVKQKTSTAVRKIGN